MMWDFSSEGRVCWGDKQKPVRQLMTGGGDGDDGGTADGNL